MPRVELEAEAEARWDPSRKGEDVAAVAAVAEVRGADTDRDAASASSSSSLPAISSSRQHTSAYVSLRQHTSVNVSIRQHTSAYVSIRQHTSAYVRIACDLFLDCQKLVAGLLHLFVRYGLGHFLFEFLERSSSGISICTFVPVKRVN
jgi:hypothetical protein